MNLPIIDLSSVIDTNLCQLSSSKIELVVCHNPLNQRLNLEIPQRQSVLSVGTKGMKQSFESQISSDFPQISDDVILLKQTFANLLIQISKNNKLIHKKKEHLKYLETLCDKNKRKIKEIEEKLAENEDKIIELDKRLNIFYESSSERIKEEKNWKLIYVEKNLASNLSFQEFKETSNLRRERN